MKKIIATFLTVLLGLSLVSCSSQSKQEEQQKSEEVIGMPNPMKEYETIDEINSIVGTHIVIPSSLTVSDVKYFTINEEIAEVDFILDGHEWTVRGSKIVDEDISGIHDENNIFNKGEDFGLYLNDYYLDRLFVEDYQYSIVLNKPDGYSEEIYSNYAFNINTTLKNASDPNGIAGSYADSTSQRATLDVLKFGDLYDLTVTWPSSVSEVTYYYISGKLEDGKIIYGGEQIVTNQFGENGEETNIDSTATNNLGYFEVKDGKLYWTGAAQDHCKECVFEKLPF